MKKTVPALVLAASLCALALSFTASAQDEPATYPSPGEIVAEAPASEWVRIAPEDLLMMDLAPDRDGKARRVVIQLMPPPFSQGWIGNIRKLAEAHWWDGTSVNRVQDNYVVQWGDATEEKVLPEGLVTVPEKDYEVPVAEGISSALKMQMQRDEKTLLEAFDKPNGEQKVLALKRAVPRDSYADEAVDYIGWPVAVDYESRSAWPVHCYGMVGVGRNLSPDTGTGAELYTVIGQAPRHLDRNIALVGRVIEGMEHLSSLPRGTGDLGFYEDPAQRVPITSVRLASELPEAAPASSSEAVGQQGLSAFEYLSTEGATFVRYADARANRRDPFFNVPAGGADICNIPVPVRKVTER